MRLARLGRALVAVGALSVALGALPAHAAPALTIAPATDLVDGQLVAVSGSDLAPGSTVGLVQCTPGAASSTQCDLDTLLTRGTDAQGDVATSFNVSRIIAVGGSLIDCAQVTCIISAAIAGQTTPLTSASLTFAPAPPPPVVTAAPDEDLVNGTSLAVFATGLDAEEGERAFAAQCPADASDLTECDEDSLGRADVGPTGDAEFDLVVSRNITTRSGSWDCREVACFVAVGVANGPIGRTPIFFRQALGMTVRPSTDLTDGKQVRVDIAALSSEGFATVVQCRAGATDFSGCDQDSIRVVTLSPEGTATFIYAVARRLYAPSRIDCVEEACVLRLVDGLQLDSPADVPLSFAPAGPLPDDVFTIDILPQGTVTDDQRFATLRAVVTCDQPLEIDIFRRLSQPGSPTEDFSRPVTCTPGEEALVFSVFDVGFSVGDARLVLSGRATAGGTEVGRAGAEADVALLDQDDVAAAILPILQTDPQAREAFLIALEALLDQEEYLRQAFYAAIVRGSP